jgi:hypothetical protein
LLFKLLLPGVNLVWIDLVSLSQVRYRQLLPKCASKAILAPRLRGRRLAAPFRSSVAISSSAAPFIMTERPALELPRWSQNRGPLHWKRTAWRRSRSFSIDDPLHGHQEGHFFDGD